MDPITHTIIAMVAMFATYLWGFWRGEKQGTLYGVAIFMSWVETRVGKAQMNTWMREYEDENS